MTPRAGLAKLSTELRCNLEPIDPGRNGTLVLVTPELRHSQQHRIPIRPRRQSHHPFRCLDRVLPGKFRKEPSEHERIHPLEDPR